MIGIAEQYEHSTRPGPDYRGFDSLPDLTSSPHPAHYIAYYLPQFHAIPENNKWWGNGFTEWTNVTKALPRYLGQYQPRLPADLGFYDLSNPDHIHNYWHSGHRLLETPLRTIYENKDINIRYFINWANETWSRRWDGSDAEILIEQKYAPGEDVQYAEYVSEFMEDERYIRIAGRPVIMIYRPRHMPDARATVDRWREFFVKRGLGNPYIIFPQKVDEFDPRPFGMDAAAGFPPHHVGFENRNIRNNLRLLDQRYVGRVFSYDEMVQFSLNNVPTDYRLLPGVCPGWDNQARRGLHALSFAGSTPAKYGKWLRKLSARAIEQASDPDERIVFINAWNEWAEGTYLEPDRHYGYAYLVETARALQSLGEGAAADGGSTSANYSQFDVSKESQINYLRNFPHRVVRWASRKLNGAS
jgi:lipopolysaccharide biosynthesis protein